jgi:cell division septal protein FtsQ
MQMSLIQEKIRGFFITNSFFRKVKGVFRYKIIPFFLKTILLLLTLLLLTFATLKLFKPQKLEALYAKSTFYFFHYLNLDNYGFDEINISGNGRISKEQILEVVDNARKNFLKNSSSDYRPLIQNIIDEIKSNLPWINTVVVSRSIPNILNISVSEYQPFAVWQNEGKKYIIDKDGNTVPFEAAEEFDHMIILSGNSANIHARSLFNIFAVSSDLSVNVYSATWVGNRRWDIRLENGLLIKLPEANISDAWASLIKIYKMPGSITGLKMIDLRIKDKIYLEYDDSVMKELKKI